jgi:hypothetical protein
LAVSRSIFTGVIATNRQHYYFHSPHSHYLLVADGIVEMALLSSTFHQMAITKKAAKEKARKPNIHNTTQEMRRQRACCPPKEVVDMTAQQAQPQALEEEDDYMSAAFIVDAAPPATSSQAPKRKRGTLASLFITLFIYFQQSVQSAEVQPEKKPLKVLEKEVRTGCVVCRCARDADALFILHHRN